MMPDMEPLWDTLAEELRNLRMEGVQSVYLADSTVELLERLNSDARRRATSHAERKSVAREPLDEEPQYAEGSSRPRPGDDVAKNFSKLLDAVTAGTASRSSSAAVAHQPDADIPDPEPFELPAGSRQERWQWLRDKVLNCPVCNAHVRPGKRVVFGIGSLDAKIFFCGEAPGAEEEMQGEPFVGPAGELLTRIIGAMGLSREDVYIGNIMNWRPEMPTEIGNRKPTMREMNFCLPYLRAQVEIVQPKVIVALGSTAVDGLLGPDSKRRIGSIRGKWFEFGQWPLMATYHPAYLLRNNANKTKRMVWEDMLQVMDKVGLPISERQRGYFL